MNKNGSNKKTNGPSQQGEIITGGVQSKRPQPLAITTTSQQQPIASVSTPHSLPPLSGSSTSTSPPTPNSVDSMLLNHHSRNNNLTLNLASLLSSSHNDNSAMPPPASKLSNASENGGGVHGKKGVGLIDDMGINESRKSTMTSESIIPLISGSQTLLDSSTTTSNPYAHFNGNSNSSLSNDGSEVF